MNQEDQIQPIPLYYDRGSITFPFDEEAFKDFMVALLGKPETIEGYVEGAFEINFDDVKNINYQIDNRILSQHDAWLLEFKAKLYFDDNSSISLNSIEELCNYEDPRQVVCTGFIFTWSYMIKFNKNKHPERQEISVFTNPEKEKHEIIIVELPRISYSLRYTERSWGLDLSVLLKNVLLSILKPKETFFELRKNLSYPDPYYIIITILPIFFLFRIILTINKNSSHLTELEKLELEKYLGNQASVSEKIDQLLRDRLIANSIDIGKNIGETLYFLILCALTLIVFICVYHLIKIENYKFILFTSKSRREKKKYFSRKKKVWLASLIGIPVNILIGIAANYIFQFLQGN